MSVKLELTFNSFDEAVVALGKLALPLQAAQPAAVAVEKAPRKSRADAGQPRGPQSNPASANKEANAAGVGTTAGAQAQGAAGQGAPAQAPAAAPAAAATAQVNAAPLTAITGGAISAQNTPTAPTPEVVQAAVEKLFNAKGFDDCAAVLAKFGVKRGKDLAADQRASFIGRVEDIVAGKYAATDSWPEQ